MGAILVITWVGGLLIYMSLSHYDCTRCLKRAQQSYDYDLLCARIGLVLVSLGCVLAAIQFAIFCN